MALSFEPISLEKQTAYQEKLALCSQIASDYSFINILGWGPEYGLEWAWQEELVWIRQTIPQTVLWAPVGDWGKADWQRVLKTAGQVSRQMIRIPEKMLTQIQQSVTLDTQPEESRDHWDYLYDIQELIDLSGNRFHKKKNLVNQFKKKYDYKFLPFGEEMINQALGMQEDWCTWRDCESNDTLAAENKAIARVLDNRDSLSGITGGALTVNNIMIAYTIAEILPDKTMVIHFEKGCPDHKGSYQAINQIFLANGAENCTVVNREQDLGDEGLRKAKLSYHPIDFIKKYQLVV